MSKPSNRKTVWVGLFVTVGTVILVATLFALGVLKDGFTRTIEVRADFAQVQGLQDGAAVWYSGVPVGTVELVELTDGGVDVTLAIKQGAAAHIPADSIASIGTDSLIGNTIVILEPGDKKARLQAGDRLESEKGVSMEDLMAEFKQTNDNLLAITGDLRQVSAEVARGEGSIGKLLEDDRLYGQLTRASGDIAAAANDARSFSRNLEQLGEEISDPDNLVAQLASDETSYAEIKRTLESFEGASREAKTLSTTLRKASEDPNSPVGVMLQSDESGEDLQKTLANLEDSSVLLEENLEAMQHNFLLRGFFKKKERRERKAKRKRDRAGSGDVDPDGQIGLDMQVPDDEDGWPLSTDDGEDQQTP